MGAEAIREILACSRRYAVMRIDYALTHACLVNGTGTFISRNSLAGEVHG